MSRAESPLLGRMIFNVGARRSGTFWLQRVVSAHPEIAAVPSETHLFFGVADLFERLHHGARSSPQVGAAYVDQNALLDATRDLCDAVFAEYAEPDARYVAERTPLHVLKLDLIAQLYPDARVIHIIRDGRDAARSLAAQDFGPARITEAAEEWREAIVAARDAALAADSYREVRYEELLADPERTLAGLYQWLDLPVSDEIVVQAVAESRTPENVDSFEIGGVGAGKWQEAFTPDDLDAFEEVAGELRAELGYPLGEVTQPERAPRRRRPRLRGKARRAARALRGEGGEEGRRRSRISHRQTIADRLLERIRSGDLDGARELLDPRALVALVSAAGRREARGEAGLALLSEAVETRLLAGRQAVGEVHASLPTIGFVFSLEQDESRSDRLVFITVPGHSVTELVIYSLPLAAGP